MVEWKYTLFSALFPPPGSTDPAPGPELANSFSVYISLMLGHASLTACSSTGELGRENKQIAQMSR
jgi:hypothetical protein